MGRSDYLETTVPLRAHKPSRSRKGFCFLNDGLLVRQVIVQGSQQAVSQRVGIETLVTFLADESSMSTAWPRRYERSKMPTMLADIRLAIVPASIARKPSLAKSWRRLGASALNPPI